MIEFKRPFLRKEAAPGGEAGQRESRLNEEIIEIRDATEKNNRIIEIQNLRIIE